MAPSVAAKNFYIIDSKLVVLAAFDFMADLFLTFFVRLPRVAVRR